MNYNNENPTPPPSAEVIDSYVTNITVELSFLKIIITIFRNENSNTTQLKMMIFKSLFTNSKVTSHYGRQT